MVVDKIMTVVIRVSGLNFSLTASISILTSWCE